ncbi:alpha/beta hydrolase fold domain-containing protein [Amycolatopsis saalfeldensis]|uniref:Acetyl esterase/lipase n=1 Tax=Amycolatopsis saalfeldensis TaxID=394193 RepID=A0A1H8Y9M1_9PSEU|nr:alpha/beta hydrolase fold domain-containing protein [Amycolatopsis saalfeldensis]SEP48766.1 Acetyl esterase/lipase [Amycolatopsis saalfeldensis]
MTTTPASLDPELAAALAAMPKATNGSLMDLTDIPALRARLNAATAQLPAPAPDPRVTVETLRVPRPDQSTLDIVLFTPAGAEDPLPALVYFHAGGQILGSAHDDTTYPSALALAISSVVAVVDYRLAPETPAPGGAEDGYLAYTHLLEHAGEHRINPERVGLAGASGGGAIATATALMVRDRGVARPRLLSLNYPMLDDRNETPSSHQVTDVGVWDRKENLLAWTAVLGDRAGRPDVHPYSAPGRATELDGMPETFIAAAQHDVFRDENIEFASRLLAAGVPVDLHVYAHAFHAWDLFAPASRLARAFERTWHGFLSQRLHG